MRIDWALQSWYGNLSKRKKKHKFQKCSIPFKNWCCFMSSSWHRFLSLSLSLSLSVYIYIYILHRALHAICNLVQTRWGNMTNSRNHLYRDLYKTRSSVLDQSSLVRLSPIRRYVQHYQVIFLLSSSFFEDYLFGSLQNLYTLLQNIPLTIVKNFHKIPE